MKLTREQITQAISDPTWWHFRHTLKGNTTEEKVAALSSWLTNDSQSSSEAERYWRHCVQVQNYLNALSRGGLIKPFSMDPNLPNPLARVEILSTRRQDG